jgi:hypothetical protein
VALFDPAESIEDGKPVREIVPGLLDRLRVANSTLG